jgi:futalosine hydrolase
MKILIVVATLAEISPFITEKQLPAANWISTDKFDICVTGVGMVATAFTLGIALSKQPYRAVLNLGVAGSFDLSVPLGEVFEIVEDCFSELGADDGQGFICIDEMGFGQSTYCATANFKLNLPTAKAITVNQVHGSTQRILELQKRLQPQLESMEGAAVFYACQKFNVPAMQVRSVSNWVEPRNKERWNLPLAIQNLNQWLIKFIAAL